MPFENLQAFVMVEANVEITWMKIDVVGCVLLFRVLLGHISGDLVKGEVARQADIHMSGHCLGHPFVCHFVHQMARCFDFGRHGTIGGRCRREHFSRQVCEVGTIVLLPTSAHASQNEFCHGNMEMLQAEISLGFVTRGDNFLILRFTLCNVSCFVAASPNCNEIPGMVNKESQDMDPEGEPWFHCKTVHKGFSCIPKAALNRTEAYCVDFTDKIAKPRGNFQHGAFFSIPHSFSR